MSFSFLYGEKYFLFLTIKRAIIVIIIVEIIHQVIISAPSESAFSNPKNRSEIFPVRGRERIDVAVATTIW